MCYVYTCVCVFLQDFRNYQYTLPVVRGLVVDMEVRKTCIKIPSNRYNEVNRTLRTPPQHRDTYLLTSFTF